MAAAAAPAEEEEEKGRFRSIHCVFDDIRNGNNFHSLAIFGFPIRMATWSAFSRLPDRRLFSGYFRTLAMPVIIQASNALIWMRIVAFKLILLTIRSITKSWRI